ncbi:MAG: hypothetical protein HUK21_07365 [Fibrobacteraceae bacterium]|nr:hypothetical protein [Fibrobacteraceae bacterium]
MNLLRVLFFTLFAALLVSCNAPFGDEDPVVVSVGDSRLTLSQIKSRIPEWDSWNDRSKLGFLQHWIDEETIYQEALESGVMEDSSLNVQLEAMTRKLIVDHFLHTFADTIMVGDGEKIDYYNKHKDMYLRGKTTYSGAVLAFSDWKNALAFYKRVKDSVFTVVPDSAQMASVAGLKKVEVMDDVEGKPDSCLAPDFEAAKVGKLQPMKLCKGAIRMYVITQRLDSADTRPYEEVAEDVRMETWLEHKNVVMERLMKQWKTERPIFYKTGVFKEKE